MKKITTILLSALIAHASVQASDLSGKKKKKNTFLSPSYRQLFSKNLNRGESSGGSFQEGMFVVSAGYGFPNLGRSIIQAFIDASQNATNVKAVGTGPLHFRGEYALSDKVGLGASINYVSAGAKWTSYNDSTKLPYANEISRSSLSILARINFHFATTEKLDPYFGIGAGWRNAIWKIDSSDPSVANHKINAYSPFGFETSIGLRYYFIPGFGLYTEMGLTKSIIQLGLVGAF